LSAHSFSGYQKQSNPIALFLMLFIFLDERGVFQPPMEPCARVRIIPMEFIYICFDKVTAEPLKQWRMLRVFIFFSVKNG